MAKFVTVHTLTALPLHNLNRDQNGLPKSVIDGAVQRGRLSSQSLKRAARVAFRGSDPVGSIRTRQAVALVLHDAVTYAAERGLAFDAAAAKSAITKVIKDLAANDAEEAAAKVAGKPPAKERDNGAARESKENILFFSNAELATLARAVVIAQQDGTAVTKDDFIKDSKSPSLDVAAFGRMFAKATDKGTQAAVAVSHAVTTHQLSLVIDYFSAVEDASQQHAGAGHIGITFYTTGVYYRSFTVDADQLARAWESFHAVGARQQLAALIRALIVALPAGKSTNTAPNMYPFIVLAEAQRCRIGYGFETPVQPGADGGYTLASAEALAQQRRLALRFDGANFSDARILHTLPEGDAPDFSAPLANDLDELVAFVVDTVYKDRV